MFSSFLELLFARIISLPFSFSYTLKPSLHFYQCQSAQFRPNCVDINCFETTNLNPFNFESVLSLRNGHYRCIKKLSFIDVWAFVSQRSAVQKS